MNSPTTRRPKGLVCAGCGRQGGVPLQNKPLPKGGVYCPRCKPPTPASPAQSPAGVLAELLAA